MARCAASALLAAIEIYNKPTFEYREGSLALLMTNAWEILLKARIVQLSDGKIQAIFRRQQGSRYFIRDTDTNEPLTISLRSAIGRTDVPDQVATNIRGLMAIRNRYAHLGILATETKRKILSFGTSSVHNFSNISKEWFGEAVEVPYLLPVGFIGEATVVRGAFPKAQRDLLRILEGLVSSSAVDSGSGYSVSMQIDIELNRELSGGGSIGVTHDPNAPKVHVSDDEMLRHYSMTYNDLARECRQRYSDFKRNARFHGILKIIKADPNCAYERKLNPGSRTSSTAIFYNADATLARLDAEYSMQSEVE